MINDESKRKLRELNMSELIDALEIQQLEPATLKLKFDDRMQRAIDYLYQEKYNNRIQRMIKSAKLRFPQADIHDIYYDGRGLDTSYWMTFSPVNTSAITRALSFRVSPVLVRLILRAH